MKAADTKVPTIEMPFAYQDPMRDYSFYKTGVTPAMTAPATNGGSRFTRHQMNGIGYLASLGTFLWQCGYPFSREDVTKVSSAIGGYPKGAIVYTIDSSGYLVEYISKVDDNTNPLPESSGTLPEENDYWAPLYETVYQATVPNYETTTSTVQETFSASYSDGDTAFNLEMNVTEPTMVVVECTIAQWANLNKLLTVFGAPSIIVQAQYGSSSPVTIGKLQIENSGTAVLSVPMGSGKVIVSSQNYNYDVYGDVTVTMNAYRMGV